MKKALDGILSIIHLIVAYLALYAGQYIAFFASNPLPVSQPVKYFIFELLYLVVGIALGILYAKFVARLSCREMGVENVLPSRVWFLIGLLLPLAVTVFYLLAMDGSIVKGDFDTAIVLTHMVLGAAVAAVVEEVLFRGMLMHAFIKKWGTAAAIIVPSVLFAAIHIIMLNSFEPIHIILLMVNGTAVGIMFSLIALQSGSVWASSIVHLLWNVIIIGGIFVVQAPGYGMAEMYLYEYELSSGNLLLTGGAFGIEAGLPGLIGFIIVSVITLWMMKKEHA